MLTFLFRQERYYSMSKAVQFIWEFFLTIPELVLPMKSAELSADDANGETHSETIEHIDTREFSKESDRATRYAFLVSYMRTVYGDAIDTAEKLFDRILFNAVRQAVTDHKNSTRAMLRLGGITPQSRKFAQFRASLDEDSLDEKAREALETLSKQFAG